MAAFFYYKQGNEVAFPPVSLSTKRFDRKKIRFLKTEKPYFQFVNLSRKDTN